MLSIRQCLCRFYVGLRPPSRYSEPGWGSYGEGNMCCMSMPDLRKVVDRLAKLDRVRCYRHVLRREEDDVRKAQRLMVGQRKRGWPRKTSRKDTQKIRSEKRRCPRSSKVGRGVLFILSDVRWMWPPSLTGTKSDWDWKKMVTQFVYIADNMRLLKELWWEQCVVGN